MKRVLDIGTGCVDRGVPKLAPARGRRTGGGGGGRRYGNQGKQWDSCVDKSMCKKEWKDTEGKSQEKEVC